MRKSASTQKQRRVGHGPYSVKAPPSSKAAAKPIACATIVTKAALFARSGLVNSKIAAVDGLAARPTPMPIRARPANTHHTSGATARAAANLVGNAAEADQHDDDDDRIDGEDSRRHRMGEVPFFGVKPV